jgi:Type II CAAX prenyl endopeptidase Rce1-like
MTSAAIPRPPRRLAAYFAASRSPRYSVLFALPLLIGYEALAAAAARPGAGELRNGADALLRAAFIAAAGARGPALLMGAIILFGLGMVVRDLRKSRERPRLSTFAIMLGESALLAVLFGLVIGALTAQLMGSLHALALGQIEQSTWPTRLMLSLGAGLYEELFFRVLLVSGLAAGAKIVLGFGRRGAGIFAAVVAALIFSAFHYIGPYGDKLQLSSFVFRALSGLAFSGLYLTRGFGITAWTHALYDAFILLG